MSVPVELVQAAIRAAEECGEDVANVPLRVLAAAGVSRSTLVRRVGGSRRALDEAVRAAGVNPGGRQPVRRRAVEVAARLSSSLEQTVCGIYWAFAVGLGRQPQVASAMLADAFSRPDGAAGRLFQRYFSRALDSVGGWLAAEVAAGRIRPMPVTLLIQQLLGPLMLHLLSRPLMNEGVGLELPDVDEVCARFAKAFVGAVGLPEGGPAPAPAASLEARTEPKREEP